MIPQMLAEAPGGVGSLTELFRPLEYLDLSQLYQRYAVLIDFAVYLLVFVGLAQLTLGKRFQGSGGKAVVIGIGVSLAISLAIAEQLLGFSLRSFGPIAAGLFLAILAVMIFQIVKHLGGGTAFSGSLSYILVLLLTVAIVPGFFVWVNNTMPLINLGLLLGFLVAGYNMVAHLFRKKGLLEKYQPALAEVKDGFREAESQLSESKQLQKHQIKPVTKAAYKASRQVLEDLRRLVSQIQKYGHLPEARRDMKAQLEKVLPKQLEFAQNLNRLQALHKRIMASDWSVYSAGVRGQLGRLDGSSQKALKVELTDEYIKLGIERQLSDAEQRIQTYQTELHRLLGQAVVALSDANPQLAADQLRKAISVEEHSIGMIQGLNSLEKQMLRHTRRELSLHRTADSLSQVWLA